MEVKSQETVIRKEITKGRKKIMETENFTTDPIPVSDKSASDNTQLHVEFGVTKPLRKFESIKISIGVTRPSSLETMDADYLATSKWIEAKITSEIESLKVPVSESDPFSD